MTDKLYTATAAKTISNTVTETTMIGSGVGNLTLPANFWVPGRTLKIHFSGSLADTSTPTGRVKLKLGSTTLVDTTALTLPALTGAVDFYGSATITCRSKSNELTLVGGSLVADMDINYGTTTAGGANNNMYAPSTLTSSVDTTVSGAVDLTWTWGTASASNVVVVDIFTMENV